MTKFAIAIASPSVREIGWVINISKRFIRFQLVNRLNRLIIKYKKQKTVISIEHKILAKLGPIFKRQENAEEYRIDLWAKRHKLRR